MLEVSANRRQLVKVVNNGAPLTCNGRIHNPVEIGIEHALEVGLGDAATGKHILSATQARSVVDHQLPWTRHGQIDSIEHQIEGTFVANGNVGCTIGNPDFAPPGVEDLPGQGDPPRRGDDLLDDDGLGRRIEITLERHLAKGDAVGKYIGTQVIVDRHRPATAAHAVEADGVFRREVGADVEHQVGHTTLDDAVEIEEGGRDVDLALGDDLGHGALDQAVTQPGEIVNITYQGVTGGIPDRGVLQYKIGRLARVGHMLPALDVEIEVARAGNGQRTSAHLAGNLDAAALVVDRDATGLIDHRTQQEEILRSGELLRDGRRKPEHGRRLARLHDVDGVLAATPGVVGQTDIVKVDVARLESHHLAVDWLDQARIVDHRIHHPHLQGRVVDDVNAGGRRRLELTSRQSALDHPGISLCRFDVDKTRRRIQIGDVEKHHIHLTSHQGEFLAIDQHGFE